MKTLDVGRDFSRFPAGRFVSDGPYSGELFRTKFLEPAVRSKEIVHVYLDSTAGYGSSFLEEAFGGLVRESHFGPDEVERAIVLETGDDSLKKEILGYIREAA